MSKKLRISLIFGNLVVAKLLNTNPRMHNLYTKFAKILEICKQRKRLSKYIFYSSFSLLTFATKK